MFGKAKKDWLRHLLELRNGIPSHVTFGRIFARIAHRFSGRGLFHRVGA